MPPLSVSIIYNGIARLEGLERKWTKVYPKMVRGYK
jgi:hypothetical protein